MIEIYDIKNILAFEEHFSDVYFGHDACLGDSLVYRKKRTGYVIPDEMDAAKFQRLIDKSLDDGKDYILELAKKRKFKKTKDIWIDPSLIY